MCGAMAMNNTELDRKYYPQYLELLNLVQEGLKIDINTELDLMVISLISVLLLDMQYLS